MKEWNITWDCLITLNRDGGGNCDTVEEIKIAVGYYLKKVFGIDDIDVCNMKIKIYKVYVNVKYSTDIPIKDWNLARCLDWLNDPINQPDKETDDSFDRAFRGEVKRQKDKLEKKEEEEERRRAGYKFVETWKPHSQSTEVKLVKR